MRLGLDHSPGGLQSLPIPRRCSAPGPEDYGGCVHDSDVPVSRRRSPERVRGRRHRCAGRNGWLSIVPLGDVRRPEGGRGQGCVNLDPEESSSGLGLLVKPVGRLVTLSQGVNDVANGSGWHTALLASATNHDANARPARLSPGFERARFAPGDVLKRGCWRPAAFRERDTASSRQGSASPPGRCTSRSRSG